MGRCLRRLARCLGVQSNNRELHRTYGNTNLVGESNNRELHRSYGNTNLIREDRAAKTAVEECQALKHKLEELERRGVDVNGILSGRVPTPAEQCQELMGKISYLENSLAGYIAMVMELEKFRDKSKEELQLECHRNNLCLKELLSRLEHVAEMFPEKKELDETQAKSRGNFKIRAEIKDRLKKGKEEAMTHLKALQFKPASRLKYDLAAFEITSEMNKSNTSVDDALKHRINRLRESCKEMANTEKERDMLAGKSALLESRMNNLIKENEILRNQNKRLQYELMCDSNQDEVALRCKITDLEAQLQELAGIKDERDKLLCENTGLKQHFGANQEELQQEIDKYQKQIKEIEEEERSQQLMFEDEKLTYILDLYKHMEDKLLPLKRKADAADRFRKELNNFLHDRAPPLHCDGRVASSSSTC